MRLISKNSKQTNQKSAKPKGLVFLLFLFVIPLGIYFWFGLGHLTQFETADEHLWISNLYTGRIQQYWNAIEQKDWSKTRINDKPGVTLALISGFNWHKEGEVRDKIIEKENLWTIYNPEKTQEVYRLYRLPIVICSGIMGLFFFLALWRLSKKHWLALAGASLVILSPVLIGISQIINPDAVLWSFSFASILSFALFLREKKWWANLIDGFLTAFFLGLALLSKYVALILIPFFLGMLLWYLLDDFQQLSEKKILRKKVLVITIGYPLIIISSIGIFSLLMPAVLLKPAILLKSILEFGNLKDILNICLTIDVFLLLDAIILESLVVEFFSKHLQFLKIVLPKIFYFCILVLFVATLINWALLDNQLHSLSAVVDSVKNSRLRKLPFYLQMISQSQPLIFASTPVVLFLMFFVWIKSIFKRSEFDYLIFVLSIFFVVFFYANTQQRILLQVRYSLILFPIASVLAGIGFYEIVRGLKHRYIFPIFLLMLLASFCSIWLIKPFYFNYANDLLPKKFIISDSWGYGGYEAMKYIQAQGGDMKNMKIWTDYYGVCQFFPGKCVAEGQVKWMKDPDVMNIDYVVSFHDGIDKNESGRERINKIFSTAVPAWELQIDGRPDNFVKVYENVRKKKKTKNFNIFDSYEESHQIFENIFWGK